MTEPKTDKPLLLNKVAYDGITYDCWVEYTGFGKEGLLMADMTDKVKIYDEDFHKLINRTVEEMRQFYLNGTNPIICGYSGKDSDTAAQLLIRALTGLPKEQLNRKVYISNVDTMVEPPAIKEFMGKRLVQVERGVKALGLPIKVIRLRPEISDTFWVNVIGRGYPAPSINFRWCTDRIKIQPTSRFIESLVETEGSAIVLVGTRKAESIARSRSLAKFDAGKGNHLKKNGNIPGSYLWAPIEDFSTDDVWTYQVTYPSAYGGHNHDLVKLYKDASDGECPLILDKSQPTCGQSRFGCFVCTVISEDKAMRNMAANDDTEVYQHLLDLRNALQHISFEESRKNWRTVVRRDGRIQEGQFELEARVDLLALVFHTEKDTGLQLVTPQELDEIYKIWRADGIYDMTDGRGFGTGTTVIEWVRNWVYHGYEYIIERKRFNPLTIGHRPQEAMFGSIKDLIMDHWKPGTYLDITECEGVLKIERGIYQPELMNEKKVFTICGVERMCYGLTDKGYLHHLEDVANRYQGGFWEFSVDFAGRTLAMLGVRRKSCRYKGEMYDQILKKACCESPIEAINKVVLGFYQTEKLFTIRDGEVTLVFEDGTEYTLDPSNMSDIARLNMGMVREVSCKEKMVFIEYQKLKGLTEKFNLAGIHGKNRRNSAWVIVPRDRTARMLRGLAELGLEVKDIKVVPKSKVTPKVLATMKPNRRRTAAKTVA